jgi:MoaA/NifB/PqqE/SkfB family radical SAM enzyme
VGDHPELKSLETVIEPCESGLFSLYINVDGKAFPCSFTEFGDGIDVTQSLDFLKDVWYSESMSAWREKLLQCNRNCPVYKI